MDLQKFFKDRYNDAVETVNKMKVYISGLGDSKKELQYKSELEVQMGQLGDIAATHFLNSELSEFLSIEKKKRLTEVKKDNVEEVIEGKTFKFMAEVAITIPNERFENCFTNIEHIIRCKNIMLSRDKKQLFKGITNVEINPDTIKYEE